ncbi:DUF6334 family protein [Sphingomonas sp.]|uniref:DUF6334 family protein n=1 Tax=Sphingomonas sp. TaxID=28214 RepID=UPI001B20DE2A|nr:DUF6334 family protein [Sphingomonas sp.]MBO9713681.1 hypothetical protein [Sphingomonas sp.]
MDLVQQLAVMGMDEHIALRFDWDEVDERPITDILGLNAMTLSDGSAVWDSVAICLDGWAVVLRVEPNTDEVIVERGAIPEGDGWRSIPSFAFARGDHLGWSWVGINSQGYKDSFTIAFSGRSPQALDPRCMFVAVASALSCYDLTLRYA